MSLIGTDPLVGTAVGETAKSVSFLECQRVTDEAFETCSLERRRHPPPLAVVMPTTDLTLQPDTPDGWERALYAFLAEKERPSGSAGLHLLRHTAPSLRLRGRRIYTLTAKGRREHAKLH